MRCWISGCDGTQTRDKSCFEGVWTVFLQNLHLLLPQVLNNSSLFHKIIQYILSSGFYILAFYLGVLFKINFIFKAYKLITISMVQFFILSFKLPAFVGLSDLQKTDVQKKNATYKSGAKHRSNIDDSVWSFRFREKILATYCLGKTYIHYIFTFCANSLSLFKGSVLYISFVQAN